jgi:GntR family transcriptional regulator
MTNKTMQDDPVTALFGRMEKTSSSPLYVQLQSRVRNAIHEGILQAGQFLPPEREIGQRMDVSRVTVRRAIDTLVQEGLLVQRQGAGTFVAKRLEQPLNFLKSYTEIMASQGKRPGSRWIDRSMGIASAEEALALQLEDGKEVVRFNRLRLADDQPMALELAAVPRSFIDNPFTVEDSLYDVLRQQGVRPVKATQLLRAITIDAERAGFLGIPTDSATLYIERLGMLADGTPVEFTRSYFPGDSYDFVTEIRDPILN